MPTITDNYVFYEAAAVGAIVSRKGWAPPRRSATAVGGEAPKQVQNAAQGKEV
jgi:hypothetical protein